MLLFFFFFVMVIVFYLLAIKYKYLLEKIMNHWILRTMAILLCYKPISERGEMICFVVKFFDFLMTLYRCQKYLSYPCIRNIYIWNVIIIFLGTRDLGCTSSCCWSWFNPCTSDCGQCRRHSSECWFNNLLRWKRYLIHVASHSDNNFSPTKIPLGHVGNFSTKEIHGHLNQRQRDQCLFLIWCALAFHIESWLSEFFNGNSLLYLCSLCKKSCHPGLQNLLQVPNMNYQNMFWVSRPTWFETVNTGEDT